MKTGNSSVHYVIKLHEIYAQTYVYDKVETVDIHIIEAVELVEMLIQHEIDREHDDIVDEDSEENVHDAHDAHDDYDSVDDEVVVEHEMMLMKKLKMVAHEME